MSRQMIALDPVIRRRPQMPGTKDHVEQPPGSLRRRVIAGNQELGLHRIRISDRIIHASNTILHSLLRLIQLFFATDHPPCSLPPYNAFV